jgi:peptidyl-prolyl cis-trans isomerase SurA
VFRATQIHERKKANAKNAENFNCLKLESNDGIDMILYTRLNLVLRYLAGGLIGLGVVMILVTQAPAAELVDRIVAVVNQDIITLVELNAALEPYVEKAKTLDNSDAEKRQMLFKVREDLLNQLIDEKLTDQEIKRTGIQVSDQDVDAAIERIKEANFSTDEDLRKALAAQGLTMAAYRKNIRDQILRSRLVNQEVKSKIAITSQDIKAYYNAHPETYAGVTKYHLRNILMVVPPLSTDSEKQEIANRMNAIAQQLAAGQSFEALAKANSQAPGANQGGELGTFAADTLAPQIRKAIEPLRAGGITPVLKTDQGLQIFQLVEVVHSPGKPLEKVSAEIEEKLFEQAVNTQFKTWLEALRNRSLIKIIK